jgi:hypothetical protein
MRISLSKTTLAQFGPNRDVLAYYFYKGETNPETIQFLLPDNVTPIDITPYTFTFKLRRQLIDNASDTKNGYSVDGLRDDPTTTDTDLSSNAIKTDAVHGILTFYIPESVTATGSTDLNQPVTFKGYLELNDNASTAPLIQQFPVLICVGDEL